jgi:hypothetical protein
MNKSAFMKAGHPPTLLAAFLYFDLAFMVWVILGPLGVQIAKDLGLTHAQKGLMVATPVLAGALLRLVMGVLVDHLKPKMTGAIGQVIVIDRAVRRLVLRHPQLRADADPRRLPRRRRCIVRRRAAARLALVSARASGHGARHRRRRQLGHRARRTVRARPGRAFGWSNVFGMALIPLSIGLRALPDRRQGRAGMPAAEGARRLLPRAEGQRRVVVHVLLLGDLRRLRRPRLVAHDLLQHAVRTRREDGRLLHRRLRLRRFAGAADRWRRRRPHRRHQERCR